jgi:glyceraldehyde-3-phosphate dehydrogenase (NADP+)
MSARSFPLWIGGSPSETRRHVEIRSPWDDRAVALVALGGAREVDLALAAAARAFEATRSASAAERAAWLEGMAAGIAARRGELAAEICAEAGKPISLARTEVDRAALTFRTGAEEAKRIGGEVLPLDVTAATRGRLGLTRRFPRGVVAGIVPFNFPLNLAAHKVAPALAAGCPIVLKPPPQAPGPTLMLAEIAREAAVPPGAVNVLLVPVEEAGALLSDPRAAVVSFTGSARVGWELKARAARKQVILELGGNAAVIVDGGADLDLAAERCAVAGYAFAGQVCIKAQRLFVDRSVYGSFKERLLAAVRDKVACGDPAQENVLCGPVIDDRSADRIMEWVEEALRGGAEALLGPARAGRLIAPTLLERTPASARVMSEEIFGPVMTLAPFESFEEAVAAVNQSLYGLQAGVFTSNLGRALQAFETIETGAVVLNDAPTFRVDPMPYGGVKESGFGREGLRYAIEEMTELKLLVLPSS